MYYRKKETGIFSKDRFYERRPPKGRYPTGTDDKFLDRIIELKELKERKRKSAENLEGKVE